MTTPVRLSRSNAYALQCFFEEYVGPITRVHERAIAELRAGLVIKPKTSAVKKTLKRRRTKGAETKAIYAEVAKRANGWCEACGSRFSPFNPAQLDHFWGRGKTAQTVENCWLLHATCHSDKTANRPNRVHWLVTFRDFAHRHGYVSEEAKIGIRIGAEHLLREAAGVGS